jgi:para-aminobenzoate synthetase/4-amino-4-deoxychorismate lyase
LEEGAKSLAGRQKVRLCLFKDGSVTLESAPLTDPPKEATAAFAKGRVNSASPFLYHKTSRRELYTQELALVPELDEVIFVNEREEVTEGANSNVVALLDGLLLTPPLACGLLPGVFRDELLEHSVIKERVLTRHDLERAKKLYLINSVRLWRPVRLYRPGLT